MKVLVFGAGINGISCALHLRRAGVDVTLVDRAEPASGTSYGNAGVLAAGSVIPVTVPGLMKKAPKMLIDRNSPLFLRLGYLPRLAPFLSRYMRHTTHQHVKYYATAMRELLWDSVAQHQTLAKGTKAMTYIGEQEYCFAYDTKEAAQADQWSWDIRSDLGYVFDTLSGAEFSAIEPAYSDRFSQVKLCKGHGMIRDPGAYLRALFDAFTDLGGTFQTAEVTGLRRGKSQLDAAQTSVGDMHADRYVFTLGPWSGGIARALGLNVPFESEGGYHLEFVNPSNMPGRPVMIASGKFVVTPMQGRLRLAGVVDFAGLDAPDNQSALSLLRRNADSLFPDMTYDRIDTWHGFRPTTANSLPLIGQIAACPNVCVGFGHQHVGLTGGAKTGALLSQTVMGTPVQTPLDAFDPNAYS